MKSLATFHLIWGELTRPDADYACQLGEEKRWLNLAPGFGSENLTEEAWLRQRDLLPLPHFIPERYPPGEHGPPRRAGLSEGAYRRHVRRRENVCRANEAISAVNSLAGFPFAKPGTPSEVQSKAMGSILKSICEAQSLQDRIHQPQCVKPFVSFCTTVLPQHTLSRKRRGQQPPEAVPKRLSFVARDWSPDLGRH